MSDKLSKQGVRDLNPKQTNQRKVHTHTFVRTTTDIIDRYDGSIYKGVVWACDCGLESQTAGM